MLKHYVLLVLVIAQGHCCSNGREISIQFTFRVVLENAERLAQEVANYNVSTKVFEEADDAMEEATLL